jgi:hypothetical protein
VVIELHRDITMTSPTMSVKRDFASRARQFS